MTKIPSTSTKSASKLRTYTPLLYNTVSSHHDPIGGSKDGFLGKNENELLVGGFNPVEKY